MYAADQRWPVVAKSAHNKNTAWRSQGRYLIRQAAGRTDLLNKVIATYFFSRTEVTHSTIVYAFGYKSAVNRLLDRGIYI